MLNPIMHYIIICEGGSENAYIQELNKYFKEQEINIIFRPSPVNTGHFKEVIKKYKCERKKNKFYIFVDYDIYKKNTNKNNDNYTKKSKGIPDFLFNYFNFEDFLILHLNKNSILEYQKKCDDKNHFNIPMKSEIYMPLIKNFFNDYKKGNLPADFKISEESLKKLFFNNQDADIKFESDFACFLQEIILQDSKRRCLTSSKNTTSSTKSLEKDSQK
ncbi:hypothetical protein [Candidatus Endomicrobiellum trichonymphae]|uniref:DUF4276 family protein n=1 Tax=Endomicrobium trichonymphae TaxID=1408204 RepID=B1H0D4_ENDTX|nr:hypothetical protein [Candidatus Endomicrobium trichonymphae]BAG13966.1 conserved hypothetical protein [Candidatus Endomicrobium trichonymphae]